MKRRTKEVILSLFLLLCSIMIIAALYYRTKYSQQEFSQLLFYLFNGVEHTSSSVISDVIKDCLFLTIILTAILYLPIITSIKYKVIMKIKISKNRKKIQIYPIEFIIKHRCLYIIVIFIIALIITIKGFGIDEYVFNRFKESKIYEEYYVNGEEVKIEFPEKKRNLVFISLESMETTLCSKESGGGWEYSIIPELEKLASENINFSHTDKLDGAYQTFGAEFTSGALVAQTAGIPLKTAATLNASNIYKGNGKYLNNAYTLGDILKKEGYNLEIMMGSEGTFGGRTQYFETNGEYNVFDVNTAIQKGKMNNADRVWWGFEDNKLFKWAKEELTNLSKQDKPFNLIIQTADTHFIDGYLSENAKKKYEQQYENVYAYSSESVYNFVNWIKKQDFYDNTTIVIIGDHLGMQNDFYSSHINNSYQRTVYNVIINSAIEGQNNKNREFSTMDFYPTILASMGVKIEGERLGLGTNLFSGEKTLIEKIGLNALNEELKKNSTFYNNVLLGEDYYIIKNLEEISTE